jgi:hypothetical protein
MDADIDAALRPIRLSLATFALQGAFFHPTAEGSAECLKQFFDLQTEIMLADIKATFAAAGVPLER